MKNKFKIVHVSTVHPDNDTRIFEKECRGLSAIGHNVTLIVQSKVSGFRNGVLIKALPICKTRFERMTFTMIRAFILALNEKADIFHLHDPELLPMGLMLRILGRHVVYDMHENVPKQILNKDWIPKFLRRPIVALVKVFEWGAFKNIAVVMAEKSYSASYKSIKEQEVILNMPIVDELMNLTPIENAKRYHIGYIGRVTRNRGALIILNALKNIRNSGFPVSFECIGTIDPDVANDNSFQAAVTEKWLHAPGRLPPRDGWPRIAGCQIGVAVLQPIGNYMESYPTKMFEYMAMGLPVVVSNFKLYRDVVEKFHCGICVDPEDNNAVTNALQFLLENPKQAKKMGQNGKDAVQDNFNWDIELDKLCDFYHKLLSK